MEIAQRRFGNLADGTPVDIFTLAHPSGISMEVLNYGCIIRSLTVPDASGKTADVVLGLENLAAYERDASYLGCVAGRYANRIADGKFKLDGQAYALATNNDPGGIPCHLHGGNVGFNKRVWQAKGVLKGDRVGVRLRYRSPAGEEAYPGTLDVLVTYWLTAERSLRIEYHATTDAPTPVNLTQHSYFNLAGHDAGRINDHELMLAADHITAANAGLIPTGELLPVAGTPFDFRTPTAIGARVDAEHPQLAFGGGYDHNFVLSRWDGSLRQAATVCEPASGRTMAVWTTEPGIQFYGGNFLDGSAEGKGGCTYPRRSGFCLETQHYPDSPNRPEFPSTILRPDEVYRHVTEYRFDAGGA